MFLLLRVNIIVEIDELSDFSWRHQVWLSLAGLTVGIVVLLPPAGCRQMADE